MGAEPNPGIKSRRNSDEAPSHVGAVHFVSRLIHRFATRNAMARTDVPNPAVYALANKLVNSKDTPQF